MLESNRMEEVFSDEFPIIVIELDDETEGLEPDEERWLIFVEGDLVGLAYDEHEAHVFAQEIWMSYHEGEDGAEG